MINRRVEQALQFFEQHAKTHAAKRELAILRGGLEAAENIQIAAGIAGACAEFTISVLEQLPRKDRENAFTKWPVLSHLWGHYQEHKKKPEENTGDDKIQTAQ